MSNFLGPNHIIATAIQPILRRNCLLRTTQLRFATKKAGGSSNNGRDSAGRRLGIKVHHNIYVTAGSIVIRQRGRKFYAGENVGMGKDHTLFSKVDGIVQFKKHHLKKKKNVISVLTEQNIVEGRQISLDGLM